MDDKWIIPLTIKIALKLVIIKPFYAKRIVELVQICRNNRSHSKCWIGLRKAPVDNFRIWHGVAISKVGEGGELI